MERSQLFDLMGELKLYGMKAAFDEIMATAVKRQHEPQLKLANSAEFTGKAGSSSQWREAELNPRNLALSRLLLRRRPRPPCARSTSVAGAVRPLPNSHRGRPGLPKIPARG